MGGSSPQATPIQLSPGAPPKPPPGWNFAKSFFDQIAPQLFNMPLPSFEGQVDPGLSPTMQHLIRGAQDYSQSPFPQSLEQASGTLGAFQNFDKLPGSDFQYQMDPSHASVYAFQKPSLERPQNPFGSAPQYGFNVQPQVSGMAEGGGGGYGAEKIVKMQEGGGGAPGPGGYSWDPNGNLAFNPNPADGRLADSRFGNFWDWVQGQTGFTPGPQHGPGAQFWDAIPPAGLDYGRGGAINPTDPMDPRQTGYGWWSADPNANGQDMPPWLKGLNDEQMSWVFDLIGNIPPGMRQPLDALGQKIVGEELMDWGGPQGPSKGGGRKRGGGGGGGVPLNFQGIPGYEPVEVNPSFVGWDPGNPNPSLVPGNQIMPEETPDFFSPPPAPARPPGGGGGGGGPRPAGPGGPSGPGNGQPRPPSDPSWLNELLALLAGAGGQPQGPGMQPSGPPGGRPHRGTQSFKGGGGSGRMFGLDNEVAVPFFAEGNVVDHPQLAMIGEAGPEVVMPLTRPAKHDGIRHMQEMLGLPVEEMQYGGGAGFGPRPQRPGGFPPPSQGFGGGTPGSFPGQPPPPMGANPPQAPQPFTPPGLAPPPAPGGTQGRTPPPGGRPSPTFTHGPGLRSGPDPSARQPTGPRPPSGQGTAPDWSGWGLEDWQKPNIGGWFKDQRANQGLSTDDLDAFNAWRTFKGYDPISSPDPAAGRQPPGPRPASPWGDYADTDFARRAQTLGFKDLADYQGFRERRGGDNVLGRMYDQLTGGQEGVSFDPAGRQPPGPRGGPETGRNIPQPDLRQPGDPRLRGVGGQEGVEFSPGGANPQLGMKAGRILPGGGVESGGFVNGQWQPNPGQSQIPGQGPNQIEWMGQQNGMPQSPFGPTSAMDVFRAAVPVMNDVMTQQIQNSLAQAGMTGNRFGTSTERNVADIGRQAGNQLTNMMGNLLYNQTQSDLDRSLEATGMGLEDARFRNQLGFQGQQNALDRALQAAGLGGQFGQAQDQMAQDRLRLPFQIGAWEQGRQDQFARLPYEDFMQSRLGFLPQLFQLIASQGGSGGMSPQFGVQQTGGSPGAIDWIGALAPLFMGMMAEGGAAGAGAPKYLEGGY